MKKMKFYLMALVAVAMMAVSCEPKEPKPGGGNDDPTATEVTVKVDNLIYYQGYEGGNFEQYVIFFTDEATQNEYYAELVSFGNEKQGPTNGKYNLDADATTLTGDLMLAFQKTVKADELDLEAQKAELEVKSNKIIVEVTYIDNSKETITFEGALPQALDFPGQNEPTEVNDFEWTANAAAIDIDTFFLGQFTLVLMDTVKNQGAMIGGFAGATWGTILNEGGSMEDFVFQPGNYLGMTIMDMNKYLEQNQLVNMVITTNYTDYIQYGEDGYITMIFDGLTPEGDFEKVYWSTQSLLTYSGTADNATIKFEAESYHGSYFQINYTGKCPQTLYDSSKAQAAPRKLAPRAKQDLGVSLFAKKGFRDIKPEFKLANLAR
ncbi:MAG: hypothetical protein J6P99_05935 [Paludibacteraceae bacterium]|nr:hypothetical protein [Paludibacteraceae bacterium]